MAAFRSITASRGISLLSTSIYLISNFVNAAHPQPRQAAASTSPYLPLTTTFVPPPNCFSDVSLFSGYGYPASYSVGLGPGNEFSACSPCWLGLATTSTCFPSGWGSSAVYSPGSCPSGYSIACSSVNLVGTLVETVATCCPSGYLCAPEDRIAAFPWYSAQPCSSYPDETLSIVALSVDSTTTITTEFPPTMAPGFAILANSVQVRFQDSNSIVATTSKSGDPSFSDPTIPQPASTSSDLSPGAKVGIGVSVGVVSLALITAIIWGIIWCRKSQRPQPVGHVANLQGHHPPQGHFPSQGYFAKPELDNSGGVVSPQRTTATGTMPMGNTHFEADTRMVHELGVPPHSELPAR